MYVKKLETWQEWFESDKVIETAFLHKWDPDEALKKRKKEADGTLVREEETWGVFDDDDKMISSLITFDRRYSFDGHDVACAELHMAGTLPESRSAGNVRALFYEIIKSKKESGNIISFLHPFSFRYYRKFGYEMAMNEFRQLIPTSELKDYKCTYTVKCVDSDEHMEALKKLYRDYALKRNLVDLRQDSYWQVKDGEFGTRDYWEFGRLKFTYLFFDRSGIPASYLTFVFVPDKEKPMLGNMRVSQFVYKDVEAFNNMLGFIYSMRSKILNVEFILPDSLDFGALIGESSAVERSVTCNFMFRVLNIPEVLNVMKQPEGKGEYSLKIEDTFYPDNTGVYKVCFEDEKTVSVQLSDCEPDMEITIETFNQLAPGFTDFETALYRSGTKVNGNEKILRKVFIKKM